MRAGLVEVVGHDHALAGRETVVLHDVRGAEGVQRLLDLLGRRTDVRARRRNARTRHHVLGEGLGALQLRGLLRGAEDGDSRRAHGVGDPRDERGLRAHDHQLGAELRGQRGHGGAVEGVDRVQLGHLRDACVPGGAVQGGDVGVEGQGTAQGVFAGATTDDKDLHGVSLTVGGGCLCGGFRREGRAGLVGSSKGRRCRRVKRSYAGGGGQEGGVRRWRRRRALVK